MSGAANKNLVLAAMAFVVAMTFIDQTIVAIANPRIQRELSLSATGSQWVINGYLLALSALFAFAGRLADVFGRRGMVMVGVIGFAAASACCGLTPKGAVAEASIICFRVIQGATAAVIQATIWGWGDSAANCQGTRVCCGERRPGADVRGIRPVLLLRQRLHTGVTRRTRRAPGSTSCTSSSALSSPPGSVGASLTVAALARRSSAAARSRPWASICSAAS
jgi:hypothetical protein